MEEKHILKGARKEGHPIFDGFAEDFSGTTQRGGNTFGKQSRPYSDQRMVNPKEK